MKHSFKQSIAVRCLLLLTVLLGTARAHADNALRIPNIGIAAGGTAEVSVMLDNTDRLKSFQFVIDLPKGLEIVDGVKATSRVPLNKGTWYAKASAKYNGGTYVTFFGDADAYISDTIGAVATFKLKASADLFDKKDTLVMKIREIDITNASNQSCHKADSFLVKVFKKELQTPVVLVNPASNTIKAGEKQAVQLALDNSVDCSTLKFTVRPSAGLSLELNEGSVVYSKLSRLSSSANISQRYNAEDGSCTFVISDMVTNLPITGNEGAFLSFNVVADKNVTSNKAATVTVNNVSFSDMDANYIDGEGGTSNVTIVGEGTVTPPASNSTLSIADVSIAAGGTAEVSVMLENEDRMKSFQFVIDLPKGLEIVDGVNATSRIPLNNGTWYAKASDKYNGGIYVTFFGNADAFISGNSGAVATFTLKASADFFDNASEPVITIREIDITNASNQSCHTTDAFQVAIHKIDVPVVEASAVMSLTPSSMELKAGEKQTVQLALNNSVACSTLKFTVRPSAGLSLELNEGSVVYSKLSRLSSSANISQRYNAEDGSCTFVISDMVTNQPITGNEGAFLSINVVADKNVTSNKAATVTVKNVSFSDMDANYIDGEGCTSNVTIVGEGTVTPPSSLSTLSMADVSILAGGTAEVSVMLENEDRMKSFQFVIDLPEGLEIVDGVKATSRIPLDKGTWYAKASDKYNGGTYVTFFGDADAFISGNSGAVATFTLKASADFFDNASEPVITIREIDITNASNQSCHTVESFQVAVTKTDLTSTMAVLPETLNINPATKRTVQLALNNPISCSTLKFTVRPSAGLSLELNEGSSVVYEKLERMSSSANVSQRYNAENGSCTFVISDMMTNQPITGNEGAFLSLNVIAADNFGETGSIEIENVSISDLDANYFTVEGCSVAFTNVKAAFDEAMTVVADVESKLAAALAVIAENCPDVKDSTAYNGSTIENMVIALRAELDSAYNACADDYADLLATYIDDINAAIEQMKADAVIAQQAYVEAARVAANQAAYAADTTAIVALREVFEAANAANAEADYAAYVDAEAVAAIAAKIDTLMSAAVAALDAVATEGTYAAVVSDEVVDAIKGKIAKVATDAQEAKAAADAAEAARVAANRAAYAADSTVIVNLKAAFEAANAANAEAEYADYVDAEAVAAVGAEIDALMPAAVAALEAVASEGTYVPVASAQVVSAIDAKMAKIVADAQAAKAAADADAAAAEAARVAANRAAYAVDSTNIVRLQNIFEAANAVNAEADYAAYIDAEAVASIAAEIDALRSAANAAIEAVATEGTYESVVSAEQVNAIEAKIAKVADDAKAAADAAEAARVAANRAAYVADSAAIADVKAAFEAANAVNAEAEYADYIDAKAVATLAAEIEALKVAAVNALEAVASEGTYAPVLSEELANAINAKMAKIVADAQAAKAAADADAAAAEAARVAANRAAYAVDSTNIAFLQKTFETANATNAEADYADYVDAEAVAAVGAEIAALESAAVDALDAVATEGTYTSVVPAELVDAIKAKIVKIAADAQAAKAAADAAEAARVAANRAAYNDDLAAISALQEKLNEVNATIAGSYAEFADADKAASLQAHINSLKAAADAALAAVENEGNYVNVSLDADDFQQALDAYLAGVIEVAEQAALKALNDKVYATLTAEVDAQKAAFEAVVAGYKADAKETFANDIEAIFNLIANEQTKLDALYADLALTEETTIDWSEINRLKEELDKAVIANGIASIKVDALSGKTVYDLNGRRVTRPVKGSIYIIDGKKVMLK